MVNVGANRSPRRLARPERASELRYSGRVRVCLRSDFWARLADGRGRQGQGQGARSGGGITVEPAWPGRPAAAQEFRAFARRSFGTVRGRQIDHLANRAQ